MRKNTVLLLFACLPVGCDAPTQPGDAPAPVAVLSASGSAGSLEPGPDDRCRVSGTVVLDAWRAPEFGEEVLHGHAVGSTEHGVRGGLRLWTSQGEEIVLEPNWVTCRRNGATIADFRGSVTWQGEPAVFAMQVQDWRRAHFAIPATRMYSPSSWDDARLEDTGDTWIPPFFPVVVGNAGNQWARLTFDGGTGHDDIRCSYRGGASSAAPTGDDVTGGVRYDFVRCEQWDDQTGKWEEDPGLLPWDPVSFRFATLRVQSGSPHHPTAAEARTTAILATGDPRSEAGRPDFFRLRIFLLDGEIVYDIGGDVVLGDVLVEVLDP